MPREDTIVAEILKYINSQPEGVAEKVQGSAISSGKADVNGCYRGHSLRIEVKTPDHGNRASKKQKLNLQRWEKAGAFCIVAYSLNDVKNLLKDINSLEKTEKQQVEEVLKRIEHIDVSSDLDCIDITPSYPNCGWAFSIYFDNEGKILDIWGGN